MKKLYLLLILLSVHFSSIFAQTIQDSLTVVGLRWDTVSIAPGIIRRHAEVPMLYNCPQNINIIEVDLKHKKDAPSLEVAVVATPNMQETSVTASQSPMAITAINGSYYDMKNGNSTCYLKLRGEVINTTQNSVFPRITGAIVIKKGKLKIEPWDKKKELKNIRKNHYEDVLASGPMMIRKSKYLPLADDSFNKTKHPRSAIVITKDKKILLVTVDGRHKGNAEGMSIFELSQLLKLLNAKDALNLDGGGSTTLWAQDQPDNGVLNMPSDNKTYDHKGERKVANVVLIKYKPKILFH